MNTSSQNGLKVLDAKMLTQVSGGGIFDGANGYAYRDKNGGWHYKVTKSPLQAVLDVMVNSWASAVAGGAAYG
ncbi:garvicin Q family class II bacteriocin [Neisseria dentiae]|uniref:garvicin Q family class II bacteriocin n=1 Tax=Neisseria dentiae TaxID=194197 RepID=UPI0035A18C0C